MVEAGIYELLLQNIINGCSSTANIDIEIDTLAPSLVINLPDTINCDQLSIELDLDISLSSQNAIQWSTTSGNIISGNTNDLAIVDAAGIYTVIVSNLLNDCLATAQTEVSIDTIAPLAVANVANILDCNNTSTLIDGNGSSEGEFSYSWTGPNNANIENAQSLMPEVNEPGIYTLLITNTTNFCTASANVIVDQNIEEPIVNILPSDILDCGTTSTSITAEVDQNNYNFNWQAADGSTIEEGNINNIIVDFPGLISLVVTNPENGCFTESSTIIEQDIAIPIIDAGEGTVLNCIEPTATLNGTNSSAGNTFSYQWTTSDGQIISAANSLHPLIQGAGLYILEVINTQNECSNQDSVIVSENVPVDAIVDASEILCVDDVAEIQISSIQGGEGPYLYSINNGDSFSNFANFTNVEAGTYQIIVQDINGCEWQSEIAIEAPNELDIQLDERAFLTLGQDYQLFLQLNIPEEEVASVQWSPAEGLSCTDCLSPIATPFETTIYQVEVVNINGCKDQTNIRLFVNRDAKVYIPNAFSPNNDGANDSFTAYSDPEMVVQIKNMRIFDRWGNALFERSDFAANDPSLGWDGRFKGSLMNDGVFAYWIEVELIDGTTTTFKGDVAIIK
jgi:gliding motility-associated-like protein